MSFALIITLLVKWTTCSTTGVCRSRARYIHAHNPHRVFVGAGSGSEWSHLWDLYGGLTFSIGGPDN